MEQDIQNKLNIRVDDDGLSVSLSGVNVFISQDQLNRLTSLLMDKLVHGIIEKILTAIDLK